MADDGSLTNFNRAMQELDLTPQEQALYRRHLANLWGDGGVDNADGSRSTLYQAVQEHEGKYYSIPTVWDGKIETEKWTNPDTGKTFDVPNATALANVEKTGWDKFPAYDDPDTADARYAKMHTYLENDANDYFNMAGMADER